MYKKRKFVKVDKSRRDNLSPQRDLFKTFYSKEKSDHRVLSAS